MFTKLSGTNNLKKYRIGGNTPQIIKIYCKVMSLVTLQEEQS